MRINIFGAQIRNVQIRRYHLSAARFILPEHTLFAAFAPYPTFEEAGRKEGLAVGPSVGPVRIVRALVSRSRSCDAVQ